MIIIILLKINSYNYIKLFSFNHLTDITTDINIPITIDIISKIKEVFLIITIIFNLNFLNNIINIGAMGNIK